MGTELTFSGSEYHGQVAPLTSLKLHLPAETVLSNAGFPTCSQETVLFDIWWEDCPEGSLAGPTGSFIAVAYNGSQAVSESGAVYPFFGPGERLYLLLVGSPPLGLEFVVEGRYEAASPPHGPTLVLSVPIVETVGPPGSEPAVSLTELQLELGATREETGGAEVSSVNLPSSCSGKLAWSVEAGFNGEAASPVGTSEEDCPSVGSRGKADTSLEVLPLPPYEEQAVTYTATVQPVGGGPVPTGAVTFYDRLLPVAGCTARPLVGIC